MPSTYGKWTEQTVNDASHCMMILGVKTTQLLKGHGPDILAYLAQWEAIERQPTSNNVENKKQT